MSTTKDAASNTAEPTPRPTCVDCQDIYDIVHLCPKHASVDALLRLAEEVTTLNPYGDVRNSEIRDTARRLVATLSNGGEQ